MVIRYGFADEHVNGLISDASQSNPALSIYYVHPEGRDAVHQGKHLKMIMGYQPPPIAYVPCIGESRRPLTTTFATDSLEYREADALLQMKFWSRARLPKCRFLVPEPEKWICDVDIHRCPAEPGTEPSITEWSLTC
jgi:hypothetical protein